jgi:tRNA (guanine-N7-)-methyltransferase
VRKPQRLPIEVLAPYLWPTPEHHGDGPIDWLALFGNNRPVEIEVGFGKGLFLVTEASARPEVNFFGVEIVRKYQLYAATRIAKRKLENVRLMCGDGLALLTNRVPPSTVSAIHVFFPDPWWKKRHHKRRLFTAPFVAASATALRPGGVFNIATDVREYYDVMRELIAAESRLAELPPPQEHAPAHDMDYLTNFERKARRQGQPIFRARFERRN